MTDIGAPAQDGISDRPGGGAKEAAIDAQDARDDSASREIDTSPVILPHDGSGLRKMLASDDANS